MRIYKTILQPVLLYGSETWPTLITFGNEILRRVFVSIEEEET